MPADYAWENDGNVGNDSTVLPPFIGHPRAVLARPGRPAATRMKGPLPMTSRTWMITGILAPPKRTH
ncbi:hypothetical protein [Streptosporangium saharense]|uniref:hypothetical protein n=1 Tax=Streptosporangium saharense TaxID=1706840 RepID=UPI00341B2FDF